jgi:S1-C subfamily serine protease
MKLLAGFLAAMLVLPSIAADRITSVTADGVSYVQIQDVHIASGGRIVLLFPSGGATLAADKLPRAFLESWGITSAQLDAAKIAEQRKAELEVTQAVRVGLFREVDGVVYDLRKSQPAWVRLSAVKLVQVTEGGALAELSPNSPNPTLVFIRNLPPNYVDNDVISVFAKSTGPFSMVTRSGYEKMIHSYDAGRACARADVPDALLKANIAFAPSAHPTTPHRHSIPSLPGQAMPRAIGSGFFVTRDGYLVTNHHVVREAEKIQVSYRGRLLEAKLVADDTTNDLAVLKVEGANFQPLPLSHKQTADLGEEVFTIGFPNIEMQGVEPKYTDGKISSLAGMMDDPTQYQISVPVQPGNSGGPLCDNHGEVVGIIVARLNDMAVLQASGAVPQNVNYAIKARLASRLLQNVKGLSLPQNQVSQPANPVKAVQDGIAMVLIY